MPATGETTRFEAPAFGGWVDPDLHPRFGRATVVSSIAHVVLLLVLLTAPVDWAPRPRHVQREELARRATPLVAPPPVRDLTQRDPNKGKISKELDLESLIPRPAMRAPAGAPKPQPQAFRPPAPAPQPSAPVIMPEPPKVEVAQQQIKVDSPLAGVAAPPAEKPKLAFESVAAAPRPAAGRLAPAKNAIDEAVKEIARTRGGGLVVGDAIDPNMPPPSMQLPPLPGRQGSALELLSDPQGVDFKPYLIKILSSVRRNWFAVIPETARLGRRGKVIIQFAIDREGRVPKLVIYVPSGAEPLDRAAVAGISASNPFPPLPSEFRGDQIRLQFTFLYNMAAN